MKKNKFDKEFIVKNRFWILLGSVVLLFLVAWLGELMAGGDTRTEKKTKYDNALNLGAKNPDIKNEKFTAPLVEKEKKLQARKNEVWGKLWDSQKTMPTFPSTTNAPLARFANGAFGEEIANDLERREFGDRLYATQLEEFKTPPSPVYYLGDWTQVIQPVTKWNPSPPPTSEEIWLAQEELWVKRELLRMIKEALDAVAHLDDVSVFKVTDPPGRGGFVPAGAVARQVCRNPYWELELIIEKQQGPEAPEAPPPAPDGTEKPEVKKPAILVLSPKSRIKNVSSDKLPRAIPGLQLRLQQSSADGSILGQAELTLKVDKPVDWNQSVEIGQVVVLGTMNSKEPINVTIVSDKSEAPLAKGVLHRQRFRNSNWELEIIVEENDKKQLTVSPKSKLKNVHSTQRQLQLSGVQFLLKQEGQTPVTVRVQGEPVAWNESSEIGESTRIDGFNLKKPIEVEQVLDWASSPIKRIDEIRLGYHSHRTAVQPLVTRKFDGAAEVVVEQAAPAQPTPGTPPAANPTPAPPAGRTGGGFAGTRPAGGTGATGGSGVAGAPKKTPNGLVRDRYSEANAQVRRMPLGMVLVVDQAHIPDVLAAFGNSKLRIQPTQVHYQHVRGVNPPAAPAEREGEKTGEGPADPNKPGKPTTPTPPPTRPGGFGTGGGKGTIPGRPFSGPVGSDSPIVEEDPNLMQLAIYGIASLYEKYPPQPATKTEGGSQPPN